MVSAVVLAYNRVAEILITIQKLKELRPHLPFPLEIIVVDNASTDETSSQISVNHPDVILRTKEMNNGVAGWNDGFDIATNKYFLVLDDDSHIESGLTEAIEYLEKTDDVGILALNVTTGPYQTSKWGWTDGQELFGFFGCGAVIRKEVYKKIGGFSDWLHVYAHEWEYGIRCLNAGYKIQYFEDSNVIHRASPANRSLKKSVVYSVRNEFAIVYKYFGEDRWKYIFRMWANMFKVLKNGEFYRLYVSILGGLEFMAMRKEIVHTPVAPQVQKFYAENYDGTKPFFNFITTRWKKWTRGKAAITSIKPTEPKLKDQESK